MRSSNPVWVAFVRLGETLRELSTYRHAFVFLLAFFAYNDGIGTVIRMATLLGEERGIPQSVMITSILLVQFVGIPFALLFGKLPRLPYGVSTVPSYAAPSQTTA